MAGESTNPQQLSLGGTAALTGFPEEIPPSVGMPNAAPVIPMNSAGITAALTASGVSPSIADQLRSHGFVQKAMQNTDELAKATPPAEAAKPGSWAKQLIGGVQTALAGGGGFSLGQPQPPGSSGITGVQSAVQAYRDRADRAQQMAAQKQQRDIENRRADSREDRELKESTARINAMTLAEGRASKDFDEKQNDRRVNIGKAAVDNLSKFHPVVGRGITEDQLKSDTITSQNPNGKYDWTKVTAYPTGVATVVRDGKEVEEPTYDILESKATPVTLDSTMAGYFKSHGHPELTEGTTMDGDDFNWKTTQMMAADTFEQKAQELEDEQKLKRLTTQKGLQTMEDKATVTGYLGQHPGDQVTALETLSQQKGADGTATPQAAAAARLLQAYDPKELETHRHNLATEKEKAEKDAQEQANKIAGAGGSVMTNEMRSNIASLPDDKKTVLNQYPTDIQATLYSLAFGAGDLDFDRVFPNRMYKGSMDMSAQHAAGLLKQLNPNWSEQQYKVLSNEYKDITTGKKSTAIEQYNNVMQHAADLQDAITGSGRANTPEFLNHGINWLEKHGYGAEVSKITTAQQVVKDEFSLLMSGGYKPNEEMQKSYDTAVSNASTPGQIGAALKEMAKTGTIRLDNINQRYHSLSGRNIPNIITPDSLKALQHLGIEQADPQTWARVGKLNSGGTIFGQGNEPSKIEKLPQPPNTTHTGISSLDNKEYYLDAQGKKLGPVYPVGPTQ